jgi:hypothetical protein
LNCTTESNGLQTAGRVWELYGNVLAQINRGGQFNFMQLPSHYRNVEEHTWSVAYSGPVRDFGMDPAQNLLVVIEAPRW